jgi:hypothetical protein
MSDDLDELFARASAEESRRKEEGRLFQEKKEKWDRARALLSQILNPSGNPLSAQLGREPTPAEAHDWYAGLLIDYCRAIRDADSTRSPPDLAPDRDGARLAVKVVRLVWEGDREAITQILDRAFSESPTLSQEMTTRLANELCHLLGAQAVSHGSRENNDPPGGSGELATEERAKEVGPIEKSKVMSDSSSANPPRRLIELEGRLYKERDSLTPAEKQDLRHEALRLRVGIAQNDIWQKLGSERCLPQNLSGKALSDSIGQFVFYMERYIDSCRELADLAQPRGIADEHCHGAFKKLVYYLFDIIDYGCSLAQLLESGGYNCKPVLRTLDCLLSHDGTPQDDGKLPDAFFSSWPKDKIKLGQMAVQAEVSAAKYNTTRTTLAAINTPEESGTVPPSAGPAEKAEHTQHSPLMRLDVLLTALRAEVQQEASAVDADRSEVHLQRSQSAAERSQLIQRLSGEARAQCRTAGVPFGDADTVLSQASELANDLLNYHADDRGREHARFVELMGRYRSVVQRLSDLSAWCENESQNGISVSHAPVEQAQVSGTGHESTEGGQAEGVDDIVESELTDRQKIILETMLENEITSERRRRTRAQIVRLVNRTHNPLSYSRDFARLVTLQYLRSLEGPKGGVWMTPTGKAEAQRLRSSS